MKRLALMAMLGSVFAFGGCVGEALVSAVTSLPVYLLSEFVTDNNGVFDLFTDN